MHCSRFGKIKNEWAMDGDMNSEINRRQFIGHASRIALGVSTIAPAGKMLHARTNNPEIREPYTSSPKIVALIGSLRKGGNTDTLVSEMLKGAEASNVKTEKIYLMEQEIKPCKLCNTCRSDERPPCILDDDCNRIIDKIQTANAVIFSTPTYWKNVSGLMKLFMERCYSLFDNEWKNSKIEGKRAALVVCCGGEDIETNTRPVIDSIEGFLEWCGVHIVEKIVASALDAGDILKNPEAMKDAANIGKMLTADTEY